MPMCEKCWADATFDSFHSCRDVSDIYHELLKAREDDPCTPEQMAGQWWDGEKDTRSMKGKSCSYQSRLKN